MTLDVLPVNSLRPILPPRRALSSARRDRGSCRRELVPHRRHGSCLPEAHGGGLPATDQLGMGDDARSARLDVTGVGAGGEAIVIHGRTSDALAITTCGPSLLPPTCRRDSSDLESVHDAGTAIDPTLKLIRSLLSISVAAVA